PALLAVPRRALPRPRTRSSSANVVPARDVCVMEMSLMVRSAAKPRVSNHEAHFGVSSYETPAFRPAPQDEAGRGSYKPKVDVMRYLEFTVASNFSFLRGGSHPEELIVQAANIGLDGI